MRTTNKKKNNFKTLGKKILCIKNCYYNKNITFQFIQHFHIKRARACIYLKILIFHLTILITSTTLKTVLVIKKYYTYHSFDI